MIVISSRNNKYFFFLVCKSNLHDFYLCGTKTTRVVTIKGRVMQQIFLGLFFLIQFFFVCADDIMQVVIPAAGLGTRFMPMTKSVPKEFVHIKDGTPSIEYVVREAADSGLTDVILVVSKGKQSLVEYFKIDHALNAFLETRGKLHYLEKLNELCLSISVRGVIQNAPLGTGHAVMCAREYITGDYFGVLYPDNPIVSDVPAMKQLIDVANMFDASVIAVQEVSEDLVSAYGVIAYEEQYAENVYRVTDVVEKPKLEDAPSNLAVIGRYVLSVDIFDSLEIIPLSLTGEYWLTDAIADLIRCGKPVLACRINGKLFDTGNPKNWFETVAYLHE